MGLAPGRESRESQEEIMATETLSNRKYSATYSLDRALSGGWVAVGELWKSENGKQIKTGIKFRADAATRQATANAAREAAEDVCPDD